MATKHTPWNNKKFPKEYKEIIVIIYKNGKPMRTNEIRQKLKSSKSLREKLKKYKREHGYLKYGSRGRAGTPFMLVISDDGDTEPIWDEAKEIMKFYECRDELATITNTTPIDFNDWEKERRNVCKEYNKIREKNIKITRHLPKLIATNISLKWDIDSSAIPILEKEFGKRLKPK